MFLPLSYTFDQSSIVYKETQKFLERNYGLKTEIQDSFYVYMSLVELIPQTLTTIFSSNRFPLYESLEDLHISYVLCSQGFYKQSIATLRNVFELNLLSLYMNIQDEGHIAIKDWMNSKQSTPSVSVFWKKISKNDNFVKFGQTYNLEEMLKEMNELHNYVHTKGLKYSNYMGKFYNGGAQVFDEEAFLQWLKYIKKIVELSALLHLIRYPLGIVEYDYSEKFGFDIPMMGVLLPEQRKKIKLCINENMLKEIEKISKSDLHVQNVMNHVKALPILSEEELDSKFINQQKQIIEDAGLSHWLKNDDVIYSSFDEDTKYNKQRDYLIKWAKVSNFIEHPFLRRAKLIKNLKKEGYSLEETK